MALTDAERQRRYRAHKRGDHSLCDPKRCPDASGGAVARDVTPGVTRDVPPQLGPRGRRLWRDVTEGGPELSPAERVLLEEACRLADRLDRLDAILRGAEDAWLQLRVDNNMVAVVVDKALSEARQQQATLSRVLAELRQTRTGATKGGRRSGVTSGAAGKGGSGVVDLAARIAAKRAQTAG